MDGRSATVAALGVAILAIVGFLLLEGTAAGLVLLLGGVLLVAIGVVGWRDRDPALATAGATAAPSVDATPSADGTDLGAEDAGEPDAPASPRSLVEDDARDAAGSLDEDRAVAATAFHDGGSPDIVDLAHDAEHEPEAPEIVDLTLEPEPSATEIVDYAPGPQPMMQLLGGDRGLDHLHDEPLLGHGDLAAHVRDYHEEIAQVGSTIQLRLLHERAHGAPHELPVNLKTS